MIEQHYLDLLTVEGFMEQFYQALPDCDNMMEAYEVIENKHMQAFNKRKYCDFESFRRSYYLYMSKRKKK